MNQRTNDFRSLGTHPYSIMVYLLLAGLTMIFVGLSAAYLYTRITTGQPPIKIPLIFIFNTVVLYASSVMFRQAQKKYLIDDTRGYQITLLITVLLTFAFMALQYYGWTILREDNPNLFKGGNMSAYVYAISVIHVFHIVAGLPFFLIFLWNAFTKLKEPVSVLVYFTDPVKQLQLRLLALYWHFLDYLWIYLMVFFWGNYFVKL